MSRADPIILTFLPLFYTAVQPLIQCVLGRLFQSLARRQNCAFQPYDFLVGKVWRAEVRGVDYAVKTLERVCFFAEVAQVVGVDVDAIPQGLVGFEV